MATTIILPADVYISKREPKFADESHQPAFGSPQWLEEVGQIFIQRIPREIFEQLWDATDNSLIIKFENGIHSDIIVDALSWMAGIGEGNAMLHITYPAPKEMKIY